MTGTNLKKLYNFFYFSILFIYINLAFLGFLEFKTDLFINIIFYEIALFIFILLIEVLTNLRNHKESLIAIEEIGFSSNVALMVLDKLKINPTKGTKGKIILFVLGVFSVLFYYKTFNIDLLSLYSLIAIIVPLIRAFEYYIRFSSSKQRIGFDELYASFLLTFCAVLFSISYLLDAYVINHRFTIIIVPVFMLSIMLLYTCSSQFTSRLFSALRVKLDPNKGAFLSTLLLIFFFVLPILYSQFLQIQKITEIQTFLYFLILSLAFLSFPKLGKEKEFWQWSFEEKLRYELRK